MKLVSKPFQLVGFPIETISSCSSIGLASPAAARSARPPLAWWQVLGPQRGFLVHNCGLVRLQLYRVPAYQHISILVYQYISIFVYQYLVYQYISILVVYQYISSILVYQQYISSILAVYQQYISMDYKNLRMDLLVLY